MSSVPRLTRKASNEFHNFLKINQSAIVRTFNRVETLNQFLTRTKAYSNSDVVLTAPAQKHLSPEEHYTQAFKTGRRHLVLRYVSYPKERNHRNNFCERKAYGTSLCRRKQICLFRVCTITICRTEVNAVGHIPQPSSRLERYRRCFPPLRVASVCRLKVLNYLEKMCRI